MENKISICIPTFNRAKYLKRCLQSVVCNPGDDLEFIVSDNCSPDSTREVVESFPDSRLQYYRNDTNIGAVRNVIATMNHAQGEYIFYLTDDDALLPGGLDLVRDFIDQGAECFSSPALVYLERQKDVAFLKYSKATRIAEKQDDFPLLSEVFLSSHMLSRLCFKRELLDMELIDENAHNMYICMLMCLTCIANGARVGYLADPVVFHTWENDIYWGEGAEASNYDDAELQRKKNRDIALALLSIHDKMDKELWEFLVFDFIAKWRVSPEDLRPCFSAKKFDELEKVLRKAERKEWFNLRLKEVEKALKTSVKRLLRLT